MSSHCHRFFSLGAIESTCRTLEMMDETLDRYGQCSHHRATVGRWNQCQIKISKPKCQKILNKILHAMEIQPCSPVDSFPQHLHLIGKYGASNFVCMQFLRDCKCYRFWSLGARHLEGQAKWCPTLNTLKGQKFADLPINSRAEHCYSLVASQTSLVHLASTWSQIRGEIRGWGILKPRCRRRVDCSSSLRWATEVLRVHRIPPTNDRMRFEVVHDSRSNAVVFNCGRRPLGVDVSSNNLCKLL